ncbi:MAG: leucyl/phenylalanyl-tRNA--protein transferase [Rhodospirillaceae bacterium]
MAVTELNSVTDSAAAEQRSSQFQESLLQTVTHCALSAAYSLRKNGLRHLLPYWRRWLAECVLPRRELPDPEQPFDSNGRVGLVYDLSVPALTAAYQRGIYTAGHFGTLAWMSPPQRCVLFLHEFHMAKRLRQFMRQGHYTVTFDRDFEGVITACAGRRQGRWHVTWITPRIMRAYAALRENGCVHSFEVWNSKGELVGGGYGVALGRIFFTESQFSHEDNTSKLGFSVLNWHLARWGYILNDGKNPTPTILNMGFRSIPRTEFLRCLADNVGSGGNARRWETEADPMTVAKWQPGAALPAAE